MHRASKSLQFAYKLLTSTMYQFGAAAASSSNFGMAYASGITPCMACCVQARSLVQLSPRLPGILPIHQQRMGVITYSAPGLSVLLEARNETKPSQIMNNVTSSPSTPVQQQEPRQQLQHKSPYTSSPPQPIDRTQRSPAPGANKRLPDFIGHPITFTASVKKVNWRGEKGLSIMTVQLPKDTWQQFLPSINHRDLPSPKGHGATAAAMRAMHKYKMNNRLISIRGTGMSKVGEGSTCRFSGLWAYTDKHGLEVQVESYSELTTTDPEILKVKLRRLMAGVGPKTADQLVKHFGEDVEKVLASDNAVTLMVTQAGISKGKAAKIKSSYDDATGEQSAESFLADLGLRDHIISAALRLWEPETLRAKMQDDPYATLMVLPGFDFPLADEVAFKMGCSHDHKSRGPAAMLQALMNCHSSGGHTFVTYKRLKQATERVLSKEDIEWSKREARRESGETSSPGPQPPRQYDGTEEDAFSDVVSVAGSNRSSPPGITVASLATMTQQKADVWMCKLLGMKKAVAEYASSPDKPPVNLTQDNLQGGFSRLNQSYPSSNKSDDGSMLPTSFDGTQTGVDSSSSTNRSMSPPLSSMPNSRSSSPEPSAPALLLPQWPDNTMVYLDPLYQAETIVASCLASKLAKLPTPHFTKLTNTVANTSGQQAADNGHVPPAGSDGASLQGVTNNHHLIPEDKALETIVWKAKNELLQQNIILTDKQVEAVRMALRLPVMLLTGAAGCGKTFGTKAIMAALREQNKHIMLCAPTGRAAQRLQEAGSEFGLEASTIHRMLGYRALDGHKGAAKEAAESASKEEGTLIPSTKTESSASASATTTATTTTAVVATRSSGVLDMGLDESMFEYNSSNPLPAHAVLVDEASMLDVQLAAALLRALPKHCQLIFIGDPNQLPPVGPGCVLHDMIQSGLFPQVHLDTIFRQGQGSAIVAGAHKVMHGHYPVQPLPGQDTSNNIASDTQGSPAANGTLAPQQPSGLPSITMDSLRERLKSARLQRPGSLRHSKRRDSPVQPLVPTTLSDDEDYVDISSPAATNPSKESSPSPAHTHVLTHLQNHLGSDGFVVLESVEEHQVGGMVTELVTLLKDAGVDAASDIQILSATKETQAGTHALNRLLQPIMNPSLAASMSLEQRARLATHARLNFKVGDRVVQIENNYDSEVFNGDLGLVTSINERANSITVQFAARPGAPSNSHHLVTYRSAEQFQLQLAWATTVHKAQGAEYPVVIMVMHDSAAKTLQQRKLLYTAITRGRRLLFLVTTPKALTYAVNEVSDKPRNTLLHVRTLQELQAKQLLPPDHPLPYPEVAVQQSRNRSTAYGSHRRPPGFPVSSSPEAMQRASMPPRKRRPTRIVTATPSTQAVTSIDVGGNNGGSTDAAVNTVQTANNDNGSQNEGRAEPGGRTVVAEEASNTTNRPVKRKKSPLQALSNLQPKQSSTVPGDKQKQPLEVVPTLQPAQSADQQSTQADPIAPPQASLDVVSQQSTPKRTFRLSRSGPKAVNSRTATPSDTEHSTPAAQTPSMPLQITSSSSAPQATMPSKVRLQRNLRPQSRGPRGLHGVRAVGDVPVPDAASQQQQQQPPGDWQQQVSGLNTLGLHLIHGDGNQAEVASEVISHDHPELITSSSSSRQGSPSALNPDVQHGNAVKDTVNHVDPPPHNKHKPIGGITLSRKRLANRRIVTTNTPST